MTTKDESPVLEITRIFEATPAEIFNAWLDREEWASWIGPEGVHCDVPLLEPRVGGGYRLSFTKEDGEYCEVGGIYREVVPNQRLVFSWAWHSTPERESLVTVTLKPDGGGTLLTLHHEQLFDQAARDSHEQGWTGMLDNLERHLA